MRKISLKIASKLAIKIETVSAHRDVFLTTSARAYQKHVLHGQDRFYVCSNSKTSEGKNTNEVKTNWKGTQESACTSDKGLPTSE